MTSAVEHPFVHWVLDVLEGFAAHARSQAPPTWVNRPISPDERIYFGDPESWATTSTYGPPFADSVTSAHRDVDDLAARPPVLVAFTIQDALVDEVAT